MIIVVANEVTEETRVRPWGALQAIIKDLSFNFKLAGGDLPGGPVVRKPCFHRRGHRFNPWSWNQDSACQSVKTIK